VNISQPKLRSEKFDVDDDDNNNNNGVKRQEFRQESVRYFTKRQTTVNKT